MKIEQFQTDFRLWLWISFGLFLASLFFMHIGVKADSMTPVAWMWHVVQVIFQGDFREAFGVSFMLVLFACIYLVASIVLAWLVQCLVVMIRTR
jgi:hypothetical protein